MHSKLTIDTRMMPVDTQGKQPGKNFNEKNKLDTHLKLIQLTKQYTYLVVFDSQVYL